MNLGIFLKGLTFSGQRVNLSNSLKGQNPLGTPQPAADRTFGPLLLLLESPGLTNQVDWHAHIGFEFQVELRPILRQILDSAIRKSDG